MVHEVACQTQATGVLLPISKKLFWLVFELYKSITTSFGVCTLFLQNGLYTAMNLFRWVLNTGNGGFCYL
jgi:hypothetical protein